MGFLHTISSQDLDMLRGIVRKVHFAEAVKKYGANFISDAECDKLIESIGPETVERMIRFGVDRGLR